MKTMLVLLILCTFPRARAEEEWGMQYTLPEHRPLWQRIMPTSGPIPYMESPYFRFEGTDFYPSLWTDGVFQFSVARYYAQGSIPGMRWKPSLELTFSNPGRATTVGEPTIVRIGFAWRRSF